MLNENIKTLIAVEDSIEFAASARAIIELVCEGDNPEEVFKEILELIAESKLSASEQSRRATVLVRVLPKELIIRDSFLRSLANLPSSLKTGISSALPPECLPAIYIKKSEKHTKSDCDISTAKTIGSSTQTDKSGAFEASQGPIVIILSSVANQESNLSLLHHSGFPAYRVTTLQQLETYLNSSDICGFLIEGSFWLGKTPSEQDKLLTKIASYSSLSCLFIDRTNFHKPSRIGELVANVRFKTPNHKQLVLRDNCVLSEADLEYLRYSAKFFLPDTRPEMFLSDLSDLEGKALLASATAFYDEECGRGSESLKRVLVKTINGGQSGAKVIVVTFNGWGVPVVIKIGYLKQILDEIERFRTYISPWDSHLKPIVHFHSELAVIIFSVVEDSCQPCGLAPTLESKIHDSWLQEAWSTGQNITNNCEDILRIIYLTCRKLEFLNMQSCDSSRHQSLAYLRGSSLREMQANGLTWNLALERSGSIIKSIEVAHQILEPNKDRAIVHGDVHLQNILAQDNVRAYLIDYAYSGPGHPAYDLVRLECSLYFRFLRPLDTEENFLTLQREISIYNADFGKLEQNFPIWFSSEINRTLIKGALYCRDSCLKVLKRFGLNQRDYIAAKYIISCYSLSIPNLQMCFVRGTIRALATEFIERSKGKSL